MQVFSKKAALLPGLKWLCLCVFCLGLSLVFIETPRERADQAFTRGMSYLNQAQSPDISQSARMNFLDQAKFVFETALAINPEHAPAWKALGHTLQQSGAPLEANLAYNASAHLIGIEERSFIPSTASIQKLSLLKLSQAELH